jgi:hypothetical protein
MKNANQELIVCIRKDVLCMWWFWSVMACLYITSWIFNDCQRNYTVKFSHPLSLCRYRERIVGGCGRSLLLSPLLPQYVVYTGTYTTNSINRKLIKTGKSIKRKRLTKDIPLDLMHYNRCYLWFSESISIMLLCGKSMKQKKSESSQTIDCPFCSNTQTQLRLPCKTEKIYVARE